MMYDAVMEIILVMCLGFSGLFRSAVGFFNLIGQKVLALTVLDLSLLQAQSFPKREHIGYQLAHTAAIC